MTPIIGLTGGIGSGKSTVASMFEKLGAVLIDADAIVHELQAPGAPLLDEIAARFGPAVIRADGSLDRPALGAIVFRDEKARRSLNQLVHPKVGVEAARRLQEALQTSPPLVILDVPLLFEGRLQGTGGAAALPFDATVLVWVPREIQIERTVARDGCDQSEAERRVAAQLSLDEKRALADHVIDNSGSTEETERQVTRLYASFTRSPEAAP